MDGFFVFLGLVFLGSCIESGLKAIARARATKEQQP